MLGAATSHRARGHGAVITNRIKRTNADDGVLSRNNKIGGVRGARQNTKEKGSGGST